VLEDGRKLHGKRVVLCLASGTGGFAAVAGRRLGGAVERNRARRILRAAWRQVGSHVGEDVDAVVVARSGIRGASTQDLVAEMTELLQR
jgi:ribonuclease P protein component